MSLTNPISQSSLFSVLPNSEIAESLGTKYRSKVQSTLLNYLEEISSKANASLGPTIAAYRQLNPKKRYSPALYSAFFALREGMMKKQSTAIYDALQTLINIRTVPYAKKGFTISSAMTESWETDFLRKMRELPIRDDSEKCGTIFPLLDADLEEARNWVTNALHLLGDLDPRLLTEFNEHVTRIKLFSGSVRGLTSQETFGALFLKLPEPTEHAVYYMLEHLVHEAAHLHLHALMSLDPLLTNSPKDGYRAPIRKDPRPMKGIFHATFVLARMTHVFRELVKKTNDAHAATFLERIEKWYEIGSDTVRNHALLTSHGRLVVSSLNELAPL